jgi:hypothetical protein
MTITSTEHKINVQSDGRQRIRVRMFDGVDEVHRESRLRPANFTFDPTVISVEPGDRPNYVDTIEARIAAAAAEAVLQQAGDEGYAALEAYLKTRTSAQRQTLLSITQTQDHQMMIRHFNYEV